jgi:L,D-peptidoglycan transpeptidase YkuD (ErfK/YbiS/YcfS/YnhG family)
MAPAPPAPGRCGGCSTAPIAGRSRGRRCWCDAPDDPAYNRPVTLPYPASAERLWRDDGVYDLIVVLGHNDDPVIAGAGSAIFLHLARPDYAPTQGCVALAAGDLEALLRVARPGDVLVISADAAP